MPNSPSYLGTVQDVQGATVSIALDDETVSGLVFIDGRGYRIGQVGSFIRIPIGFRDLFGVVSQVGAGAAPPALAEAEPYGHRWLRVQLVGEGQRVGGFKRGIAQYPTIGDEAHLLVEEDLDRIFGQTDGPNLLRIGSLASAESIPALVNVDRLITRHSAVLGMTGAGKSTTVSSLLNSVSDPARFPSSRALVIDIHGEYSTALSDRANVFKVSADSSKGERPLFVPYWAMSFDELLELTPFRNVDDTGRAALLEKISKLKAKSLEEQPRDGVAVDSVTVDSPVPFSIHRLWYELYRSVCSTHTAQSANQDSSTEAIQMQDGEALLGDIMTVTAPSYCPISQSGPGRVYLSGSPLNIRRQLHATQSLLRDSRYDFLFRPGPYCPEPTLQNLDAQPEKDIDDLLKAWIGGKRTISILDLSGVPTSILEDLVGVLLRLLFDSLFWARGRPEGGRRRPLLLVLEEAHNYLAPGLKGPAARVVRRIVKEGRKYGLGAMIVSQRPSEVDSTVLSQCGTMFAMRLANSTDRTHVAGTVSDNLEGLFDMLPSLRTGEVIVVGEAVHLPLRAVVDLPPSNRRPDSRDPKIYDSTGEDGWNRPRREEHYEIVLERWRRESPTPINDTEE